MTNTKLTKEDYPKLLAYLKDIPVGLSEIDIARYKAMAEKPVKLQEVFGFVDYLMTEMNKKFAIVARDGQVTSRLVTKRLNISDEEWDKETLDFDREIKEASEQSAKRYLELAKKVKSGELTQEQAINQFRKGEA